MTVSQAARAEQRPLERLAGHYLPDLVYGFLL